MTQTRDAMAALTGTRAKKPRVLAYGPLPPPYGGQAISFALLTEGLRATGEWDVRVVNVGVPDWQPRQLSFRRLWRTASTLLNALAEVPFAGVFYLTIGGSRAAFLRDAALVWWAWLWRRPVV
ncbi:MAG: hypothetical protein FJ315_06010, partial [SAR202 cluster bacterium]|nr:hypothetical protein [SAR202 cluster bacterium]